MTEQSLTPRSRLSDEALADLSELRRRHPRVFEESRRHLIVAAVAASLVALAIFALIHFDFSWPRIAEGLGRLIDFTSRMFPPTDGGHTATYVKALGETLAISFLGTLTAAIFAFPFAFLAARNVIPNFFLRFGARRILDTIRGVDTLVWALIWVGVVGLGPFAGVLAIACADFGALGKLFSETIETADRKPIEGVTAAGGTRLEALRFGLVPQILPVIASQILYFIESNTRSATVIGIVGAGGIGVHLAEQIRVLEMQQVSFLMLLILIAVASIDFISGKLRFAIIGRAAPLI
jgi:phosphonate transport system permease protein